MELSIVIPVFNEEDNIKPMMDALDGALRSLDFEIIFVDDGSTDKTVDNIIAHSKKKPHIRLLSFARNYGQTSAMAAGIDAAAGKYVATLDGDLQNDPSDIPMMLSKLKKEKLDIIAGIREKRQDGLYLRKVPSKIANYLIRRLTQVHITDYGCTLKIFTADIAKRLDLYGELHRFIPILGAMEGAKISEVRVKHHARQHGASKYGLGRTFKVLSDLMLMLFFLKYKQKPMHLFGSIGAYMLLIGGFIESYLLLLKITGEDIGHRPLFYVGILFIITGVQFITGGFLAELSTRTYYESQNKRPYRISRRYKGGRKQP